MRVQPVFPRPVRQSRRRLLPRSVPAVGAALCLWSGVAHAEQCDFFDASADEFVQAGCIVTYEGSSEIMTFGKKRVVFVLADRQGQWATGTLNGKPAMRFEINREEFSYAATDLTLFVSRSR